MQDAAAALPARLLRPGPASGSPTCARRPAARPPSSRRPGAEVLAVDRSAKRLERARGEPRPPQARGRRPAPPTPTTLDEEPFDAILLDAPCSATGTIRRHPDVAWTKGEDGRRRSSPASRRASSTGRRRSSGRAAGSSTAPARSNRRRARARPQAFWRAIRISSATGSTPDEIGGLAEAITPEGDLRTLPCHLACLTGHAAGRRLLRGPVRRRCASADGIVVTMLFEMEHRIGPDRADHFGRCSESCARHQMLTKRRGVGPKVRPGYRRPKGEAWNGGRIAGGFTGSPCARRAGPCAGSSSWSAVLAAPRHAGADPAALRAPGPAHRRPDRGGRHLCRLLRLRRARRSRPAAARPSTSSRPRRAWGEALYGFGWLRHLRAAGTALAQANARSLVDEFISTTKRRPPPRPRDPGGRAAADLVHEPVAPHPRRGRSRLLSALPAGHRPLGARPRARRCAPSRCPTAPDGGDRACAMRACAARASTARCGARPGFSPASSTARSCPDGGHASRNPRRADRAPLRSPAPAADVRQPGGRHARGAAARDRPHAADGAPVPARRRHPVAFQRHGGDRGRPPRDAAHLRRHAQPADPPRALFGLRAPRGGPVAPRRGCRRRVRRPALSRGGRRRAACRSNSRAAGSASSSIAALPRIASEAVAAGGPLDAGPFDRLHRRRVVLPVPAPWRALARPLARALAPAAGSGPSRSTGPARASRAERSERDHVQVLEASHDGYRAPLRPHPRAPLAAFARRASGSRARTCFSATGRRRGRTRR